MVLVVQMIELEGPQEDVRHGGDVIPVCFTGMKNGREALIRLLSATRGLITPNKVAYLALRMAFTLM